MPAEIAAQTGQGALGGLRRGRVAVWVIATSEVTAASLRT